MSKGRAIAEALRSLQTKYFSNRYRRRIAQDHAWVVSLSRDGRLDETIFRSSFARSQTTCHSRSARQRPPGAPILRQVYRVKPSVQPTRSSNGTDTTPGASQSRLFIARLRLSPKDDRPETQPSSFRDRIISMPRRSLMTMRHRGPICRRSLSCIGLESSILQRELNEIVVGTALARRLRMRSNRHCNLTSSE